MDSKTAKQLIADFGLTPNKALGQNFLIDDTAVDKIVRIALKGCGDNTDIIEIGAGLGNLTLALCKEANKVVTVEIDTELKPLLKAQLFGIKNSSLIYNDFLKADICNIIEAFELTQPVTIVSNLPYALTAKILNKLFINHRLIKRAVLMMQSEVAKKLQSPPGLKTYRPISVLCQSLCEVNEIFTLSPSQFYPQPAVLSTVLCLDFTKSCPAWDIDIKSFSGFLTYLFNNRRKTLQSALKGSRYADLQKLSSLPENLRIETLNSQKLVSLYKNLFF